MIDPKVTVAWPDHLRWHWIACRMRRMARRDRKHLHLRGGLHREWIEHGDAVG